MKPDGPATSSPKLSLGMDLVALLRGKRATSVGAFE